MDKLVTTTADPHPRGAAPAAALAATDPVDVRAAAGTDRPLAGDLLQGVGAIGRYLGLSQRRTFYLIERRALPAFKWAGRWCARRSTLRAFVERLEAEAGHGAAR